MKPKKILERLPLRITQNTVEALERLSVSYNGVVAQASTFEADQAVRRVVEIALQNARNTQRSA